MKQKILHKKDLLYGIPFLLIGFPLKQDAQNIKRQSISSYGSSLLTDHVLIGQTAGQSYNTGADSRNTTVSQGFQQPNTFSVEDVSVTSFKNLNVLVYPNPASRSITIASNDNIEQSVIRVADVSGKYIFFEKVYNLLSYSINCSSWVNGVYLITIYDSMQNSKTLKLIISK